ncbi:MAG: hypothetical protein ACRENP_29745 [Longimicrobiales bacterium]
MILVTGILIAFSLESWWTERGEQKQERAHLTALRADFLQNRERLDSVAVMLGQVQHAGAALLRAVQDPRRAPAADSLSSLVAAVFRLVGFEPVTSAYDNLVNAHDLKLVQDAQLRLALATFASHVVWVKEVERWQNEQWVFLNQSFINERIEVSDLSRYWVGAESRVRLPRSSSITDWPVVLRDRTFRNIVLQRIIAADDVRRTQQALHGQTNQILELLEEAISARNR